MQNELLNKFIFYFYVHLKYWNYFHTNKFIQEKIRISRLQDAFQELFFEIYSMSFSAL